MKMFHKKLSKWKISMDMVIEINMFFFFVMGHGQEKSPIATFCIIKYYRFKYFSIENIIGMKMFNQKY